MAASIERESKTILTADDKTGGAFASFQKSVTSAKDAALGLQGALVGLATTGIIGGFAAMVAKSMEAADQMGKLAQKAGIATEEMSKLAYAAKLSDVDATALTKGIKGLSEQMVKAGDETSKASQIMKAMGVDIRGGVSEALSKIADTFKALPDGATKTALAVEVFGKAGQDLIPMLNQGAAGIEKLKEEAEKLGLVISDDTAKAAEQFNDNLKAIETAAGALGRTIVNDIGPALAGVAENVKDAYIEGGKLHALWVLLGAAGTAAFTDDMLNRVEKLTKEINSLNKEFQNLAEMQQQTGTMSWLRSIFGVDKDITTEINRVTAAMSDLRAERYKLIHSGTEKKDLIATDKSVLDGLYGTPGDDQAANEERIRNLLGAGAIAQVKSDLLGLGKLLGEIFSKDAGYAADFAEKMSLLVTAFTTGRIDAQTFGAAQAALISQQPIITKGIEEQAKALEHLAKWYADIRQAELDEINTRDDLLNSFEDGNAQLQIEIDTLGMTATQRDLYLLGLEKEKALKGAITDKDVTYIEKLDAERKAMLGSRDERAQQLAFWDDLAGRSGAFFGDLVVNGKSAFDRLRQSLKQLAADLIAFFAKRYILQTVAGMSGTFGATAANAAGSAASGMGSSLMGTAIGAGGSYIGSALFGTAGTATAVGAGGIGSGVVAVGGMEAAVGAGGTAGAIGAGGAAATTAGIGAGVESALAAIPVYGWIALAAIAAYALLAGKGGGPKSGGSFTGNFDATGVMSGGSSPGWYGVSTNNTDVQKLVAGGGSSLASLIKAYGGTSGGYSLGLGYDADPNGTAQSRITSFLKDASGQTLFGSNGRDIGRGNESAALSLEMSRLLVEGLKASNISADIKALFDGFDTANATQDAINALIASADEMNGILTQIATVTIGGLTVTALKQMQAAGETLVQTAARVTTSFTSLQDLFSTDAEKTARDQQAIADAFAKINVAVPDSIAGFKALIDSLDLSTDSGRALFDVLVATGPKFKEIQDKLGGLVGGVTDALATAYQTVISLNDQTGINIHTPGFGATDASNSARGSLASYLQGSLLGAASPLDPMAQYAEARRQYQQNLIAAQGGDAGAISAFGSYRDSFLTASRAVNASSGQYNTDFFGSYNAGAALTGGLVGPYTVQAGQQNTQTIVQALAASTNATIEAATLAVDKTNELLARIEANTAKPASPGALTPTTL